LNYFHAIMQQADLRHSFPQIHLQVLLSVRKYHHFSAARAPGR
jgi:hypothetical protein